MSIEERLGDNGGSSWVYGNAREGFEIYTFLATLAAIVAILGTIAVYDGEGRKDWNHVGPVPANVKQISKDKYLIAKGGPDSHFVCGGGTDSTARIPGTGETFVDCYEDDKVSWNDHRDRSVNFAHAAEHIATATWGQLLIGLYLAIAWLPMSIFVAYWANKARKLEKANQPKRIDMEKARLVAAAEIGGRYDRLTSELKVEWTKPNTPMSDEDFERKLGELEAKRDQELNNL